MAIDRWWDRAECKVITRGSYVLTDKERCDIFYPPEETEAACRRGKSICARCTVSDQCLEEALSYEQYETRPQGIRGGLDGDERLAILVRRSV